MSKGRIKTYILVVAAVMVLAACNSPKCALRGYDLECVDSGIENNDGYYEPLHILGDRPIELRMRKVTKNGDRYRIKGTVLDKVCLGNAAYPSLFLVTSERPNYKIIRKLCVGKITGDFNCTFKWDKQTSDPIIVIDAVGYHGAAYSVKSTEAKSFAHNKLWFNGKKVVSLSITDYYKKNSLLQYTDSNSRKIEVRRREYYENSRVFHDALNEMQLMLLEIGHDRKPTAEELGIDEAALKRRIDKTNRWIPEKYISVKMMNKWLKDEYHINDTEEGHNWIKIRTGQPCGIRIVVRTEDETYYFDMEEADEFQTYWMRSTKKDGIRNIVNFNVNKHLIELFRCLRIGRKVPWSNEVIDKYVSDCSEKGID